MKRDVAHDILEAAADGVPFKREYIDAALIATGDLPRKGGVKKGQNIGGLLTREDLRQRCYVEPETGCWHWKAGKSKDKPCVYVPAFGRVTSLGSAICFLKKGRAPLKGERWFVTCSTPRCANPDHRACGTQRSVMQAPSVPKRSAAHNAKIMLSSRATRSKCTPEIAEEIRNSNESGPELEARFGISRSLVSLIRLGKAWRPVCHGASVFALGGGAR